ncbi:hypothetical protein Emag_005424 [Eimeria magna]
MITARKLTLLGCFFSFAAVSLEQSLLHDGGVVLAAAEVRAAAATTAYTAEGNETDGGEIEENEEAIPSLSRLPSLAELRASLLSSTSGLGCSPARILVVTKTQLDLEDPTLKSELTKLGCLNVAIIDLQGLQATVGLFKQGVVSRMRIDKKEMERYGGSCDDKLTPLTFHQHEFGRGAVSRGQFNENGACGPANTGGHHDPGFACGPLGGSACEELQIDPSSSSSSTNSSSSSSSSSRSFADPCFLIAEAELVSIVALKGTPMDRGEYQCTPDIYEKRPFACHAGDLSGKVGAGINVSPDSNRPDFRLLALDSHADNTCVASDNKQSLVLHCESTNFRLACAPFERVETAGKRIPELLHELIRVARNALPHSKSQSSLLASLVLVHELEQRVAALETAVKAARPGDEEEADELLRRSP